MTRDTLINWGSYDVDNFGDLLFPFLVEHFLGHRYREVVHVSPTGTRSVWPDAKHSCAIVDVVERTTAAELIIGGGNLISYTASSSINYVENPEFARIVHPSFAWVPYVLLAKHGIPYAYNRVGVAKPIPAEKRTLVKQVIEPASFLSCRDAPSAGHLREAGVNSTLFVSPDSAIDIARVFRPAELSRHYQNEAREKYGIPIGVTTAVVHVKERYLKGQFDALTSIIELLARNAVHAVLIPLGICHGDDSLLLDRRLQTSSATCISNPELLVDVLSLLAASNFYIGSSLHGAVTSLAYRNNVVIVADEQSSGMAKFSGFLSQVALSRCLFPSWEHACEVLSTQGMTMFGRLSRSTIAALAGGRDVWNDIYESLLRPRAAEIPLVLDEAIERTVHAHYGI